MSPRPVLLVLSALLIVAALIMGFSPHRGGDMCGSVFKPDNGVAEMYDSLSGSPGGAGASCIEAISNAKPVTYGALGFGVLAGLLALVVPVGERKKVPAQPPAATTAT